jgi:hypothetical protein
MCALFAFRPEAALSAIQSMMANPGLLLMAGLFTLVAGLAMVIGHNRWSGGGLTIAVTVLGWLTLIKGAAILAAPPGTLSSFYHGIGYPGSFRAMMAVAGLAGLALAWATFRVKPTPGT